MVYRIPLIQYHCAEWEKNWQTNYSQFTKDSESTNKIKGKGAGEIYTRHR